MSKTTEKLLLCHVLGYMYALFVIRQCVADVAQVEKRRLVLLCTGPLVKPVVTGLAFL